MIKQNSPQHLQDVPQPMDRHESVDKLNQVLGDITRDAQMQPEKYLNETIVPEGGE